MVFSPLKRTIGDIRRFRSVVMVLFDEGLSFFVEALKLRYLLPLRARMVGFLTRKVEGDSDLASVASIDPILPERFRRAFERLGPTFMKLGQLLSLRPDIIPENFAQEFAKLQDQAKTLSAGVAEKIVEDELGQPIENIFSEFEERPLAAASLAQVHRAVLLDGTPVAVKVRRPGVVEMVKTDIHILAYLAASLERHVPESRRFRPTRVAREFADWTLRELDFETEGSHIDRFRKLFSDDPSVVIPKVYWEYTRSGVLVSDLIEGVRVDDYVALEQKGIDRTEVARIGIRTGLKQFLVEGFFHADPHPGNLVALPPPSSPIVRDENSTDGPRLGIYDFGMIGILPERIRYELISTFVSFVNKDVDSYVSHILDIADKTDDADEESFISEVRTLLGGVLYKPAQRKEIALSFYKVLLAGAKYGVIFPTDLILLGKSFYTLETVGLRLYPEIDIEAEIRPFLLDVVKEETRPKKIVEGIQSEGFDTLHFLRHLPRQTRDLLERLEKGQIGVKIDLEELRELKQEFDRQNDVRVLAVLASALLVGSALIIRLDETVSAMGLSLGRIGFAAAMVVVIWLFVLIRKKP